MTTIPPPPLQLGGDPSKAANASGVRFLVLDVDGVLTDGSIMLDDQGVETKRFNVRDGQGITAWIRLGHEVAIITKRGGPALMHRCRELGITRVVQGWGQKAGPGSTVGPMNKLAALRQLSEETQVKLEEISYVGDDWPDIAPMQACGLPIAVADADRHVKQAAAVVTGARGGCGAVREAIEHILHAQGELERVIELTGQR